MSVTGLAQKSQGMLRLELMIVCGANGTGLGRAKEAVASMIKRLAHRNANVQLYTLEVRRSL